MQDSDDLVKEVDESINIFSAEEKPDYVENNMIKFIQILRNLGIKISLAESIEAMEALKLTDIIDKKEVKATLRSLLVKNNYEREIFDEAFEAFFVAQKEKKQRQEARKQEIKQQEEAKRKAEEDLTFKREKGISNEDEELELNLTDEQKETYTQLTEEAKQKIRDYIEDSFPGHLQYSSNVQPMLEKMVGGLLNYWKRQLKNSDQEEQQQRDLESKLTGDLEMDTVIQQVVSSLQEDESLLTQDLKEIPEDKLSQVTMIIKKLSHKLATKISRRFQNSLKTDKIDLRKTIRNNIKYGGVMLDLEYKTKKIQKPKFLLICDVSDSMARYATFVLQFIYGISSAVQDIESFIFSEDLERITEYFNSNLSFKDTMAKVISNSEEWGETTDLNQALETFQHQHLDLLTPETILFIMSDTKTLQYKEAAAKLEDMRDQLKDIVWLNTLDQSKWDELESVQAFKDVTKMVECYTIKHLNNSLKINILT